MKEQTHLKKTVIASLLAAGLLANHSAVAQSANIINTGGGLQSLFGAPTYASGTVTVNASPLSVGYFALSTTFDRASAWSFTTSFTGTNPGVGLCFDATCSFSSFDIGVLNGNPASSSSPYTFTNSDTRFGGTVYAIQFYSNSGTGTFSNFCLSLTAPCGLPLVINGADVLNISSNQAGIAFQTDNIASLVAGVNVTAPVTTNIDNQGRLSINGLSNLISVGASGLSINLLEVHGGANTNTIINDLYAKTILLDGNLNIGGVSVGNVIFGSGVSLSLNGGLIGNIDYGNVPGTVNLADTKNLNGNISSTGGRNGVFNVLGTSTVTGTVAGLNAINAGANGKTVTFSSGVDTTMLNLSGTGTINLNGGLTGSLDFNNKAGTVVLANNQNLTGNVQSTGGTATGSTLTFAGSSAVTGNVAGVDVINAGANGSVVSVSGTVAANTLNITGNGTVNTTGGLALTGGLGLGSTGTLDLGLSTTTVGTFNSAGAGTINVSSSGDGTALTGNGKIVATSGSMSGNEHIVINMPGAGVANGAKFKLIDFAGGSSAKTLVNGNISTNSATLTFKAQSGNEVGSLLNSSAGAAGEDLWVLASFGSGGASYASSGGISSSNPSVGAANTLSDIASTTGGRGDMQTVINTFNTYSAAQLNREVPKLAPISNNALTSASFSTVNAGMGNVSARLANLRGEQLASAGQTGLSAGDDERSRSVWLKGFGSWGKQDAKDAYNGYKASSAGMSLGADTLVGTSDLRLGVAFSHAGTGVDQQDERTGDSTNIKSYQGTFYAMKEFGAAYLDGLLAYARHDYKSHRATAMGRTASGDWSGAQLSARADAGYRIPMGAATVIPMASLEWSRLKQDAYTETGAGALDLNVDAATTTRLRSGLGARLQAETSVGNLAVKPEARLVWFHDFKDAGTDTTTAYTGGGASFSTPGQQIEKDVINVGFGVTVQPNKLARISLNYDFEGRSGYQSHALQLTGRWDF